MASRFVVIRTDCKGWNPSARYEGKRPDSYRYAQNQRGLRFLPISFAISAASSINLARSSSLIFFIAGRNNSASRHASSGSNDRCSRSLISLFKLRRPRAISSLSLRSAMNRIWKLLGFSGAVMPDLWRNAPCAEMVPQTANEPLKWYYLSPLFTA